MKKWLLILLGLILIALLTYFCFTSKYQGISENLITNTKNALGKQNSWINVGINGKGLKRTRIITLKGVALNADEKSKAEEIARSVEGVADVDNQITVKAAPSPYTISAIKDKENRVTLKGYVPNSSVHKELVSDAQSLFGEASVTDELKESRGAPKGWYDTSKLGLEKLKDVEYGEFDISDSNFHFKGYVGSLDDKDILVAHLDSALNSSYRGSYEVDAPEPKVVPKVQEPLKVVKVTAEPVPSPYTISAIKDKENRVTLKGYVPNSSVHKELVSDAQSLFGEASVTDELKESRGAPKGWYDTSKLGLEKLKDVEYGEFDISDSNFHFKGYVGSLDDKDILVAHLDSALNSSYRGSYEVDAPEPKVVPKAEEPNPEPTNIESCKSKIDTLLSQNKIHFEYNKATIKKESFILLDNLIKVINECPNSKVIIEGHTDSDGSKRYNKSLSTKRANAVKVYLVQKGVAEKRLEAIGYGESKPIATNATKEGKEKNRRIEFKFKGVE